MIVDGQGRPMVAVYTCQGEAEAAIVATYLREHNVSAEIDPDGPMDLAGMVQFGGGLWQYHVKVPQGCVDAAERLIGEAQFSGGFSG